MVFRIKRTTLLKKLMNAFCEKKGVQFGTYLFTLDGKVIHNEQTPKMVCLPVSFSSH